MDKVKQAIMKYYEAQKLLLFYRNYLNTMTSFEDYDYDEYLIVKKSIEELETDIDKMEYEAEIESKQGLKIPGYIGKWSAVERDMYKGKKVYLMEHDTYGDETQALIINENNELVMDEVWNGFSDLEMLDYEDELWRI